MLAELNYIGILGAGAAGFAFGALFYTIFGTPWRVALGKTEEEIKETMSAGPFIRAAVGQLILAAVLSLLIGPVPGIEQGMQMGFVLWLGVVMTTMAINHGFQGQSNALTLIDGAHWLGVLTVQGIVLGLI